jgi:cytochrome c oxidase subunit 1
LSVELSAIGGCILVISGLLFLVILFRGQRAPSIDVGSYRFATAIHAPTSVPAPLNGFALWLTLMVGLTITNYGFPIAQLVARTDTSVPAVYVGSQP